MPAVADTSYVLAIAIDTEAGHQACLAAHKQQDIIYLPQTTLAEVAYLITREAGNKAAARFMLNLPRTKYRIEALTAEDLRRTGELLQQYADSRVDFVDATIAAVAERKSITQILTLDQRDFHIIRPRHCAHFTLLP
jgi:predicted nucleic acid-binding protein